MNNKMMVKFINEWMITKSVQFEHKKNDGLSLRGGELGISVQCFNIWQDLSL